jgi:hypothetical protein
MAGPSLYRMGELDEARRWGGMAFQEYDPDQAREWIKGQGLEGHLAPEDRTYNQLELSILARRKKAELQRQYVLERAGGGFARGSERLLLSLGTSLADPLTVASAFVPVVNEATYGRLLAGAGASMFARAGVRAGLGAVEGLAGAALLEPIVYAAKAQEQADYDLYDSMANIAFGGLFGGGLHSVGGAVLDFRTGRREVRLSEANTLLRNRLETLDAEAQRFGVTPETRLDLPPAVEGERVVAVERAIDDLLPASRADDLATARSALAKLAKLAPDYPGADLLREAAAEPDNSSTTPGN